MRGFLSALLLVVVVGIGCDRQQQAAARSQPVDYFAKKRECFELAAKRQARDEAATAKHPIVAGFVDLRPEQCYVPSMNTCIYEWGFLETKSAKSIMTTEDLLTSHVLAGGNSDDPAYKLERDRLFALCAK